MEEDNIFGDTEYSAIINFTREIYKIIGFRTIKLLSKEIIKNNHFSTLNDIRTYGKDLEDCLSGKAISKQKRKNIAIAVSRVLYEKYKIIEDYFKDKDDTTLIYIIDIINKINKQRESNVDDKIENNIIARQIFKNWSNLSKKDVSKLTSGVYQMVRRYKPIIREGDTKGLKDDNESVYDWKLAENHVVIFEVMLIDISKSLCIFVTSERNIYTGTMFISHNDVMSIILQRRSSYKPSGSMHHRFISLKLERKDLPIYSGLCVKTGDTTGRPVASECFFLNIPIDGNETLYAELEYIKSNINEQHVVGKSSSINQYISDNPPTSTYDPEKPDPLWKRVRFVREFSTLKRLVTEDVRVILFREPLRTLHAEQILGMDFLRIDTFKQE